MSAFEVRTIPEDSKGMQSTLMMFINLDYCDAVACKTEKARRGTRTRRRLHGPVFGQGDCSIRGCASYKDSEAPCARD